MKFFRHLLAVILALFALEADATHNRAGEITYRHLGGFQFQATIITSNKASSPAASPLVGINWSYGIVDTIFPVNGIGLGYM